MECRLCGYEINTKEMRESCPPHQCSGCKSCNKVICPRCGYANDLVYETEFQFISDLKSKIKAMRATK